MPLTQTTRAARQLIQCALLAVLLAPAASAQNALDKDAREAVYVEAFGSGIGITLNYDRRLDVGLIALRPRIGFGFAPNGYEYSDDGFDATLPVSVSLGYGVLEVGGGITLTTLDRNSTVVTGTVSLRLEDLTIPGMILRLSFTPVYGQPDIHLEGCGHYDSCDPRRIKWSWFGVSAGYAF